MHVDRDRDKETLERVRARERARAAGHAMCHASNVGTMCSATACSIVSERMFTVSVS